MREGDQRSFGNFSKKSSDLVAGSFPELCPSGAQVVSGEAASARGFGYPSSSQSQQVPLKL